MRTKIYEERTKEEIEIERQRLDVKLTYQTLVNEHLANQLKEMEEKKMKNKLKKIFTKKEKEAKVYDKLMYSYCNSTEAELTKEETEKLLDELTDIAMRGGRVMFGIGFAGLVAALTALIIISLDNNGEDE